MVNNSVNKNLDTLVNNSVNKNLDTLVNNSVNNQIEQNKKQIITEEITIINNINDKTNSELKDKIEEKTFFLDIKNEDDYAYGEENVKSNTYIQVKPTTPPLSPNKVKPTTPPLSPVKTKQSYPPKKILSPKKKTQPPPKIELKDQPVTFKKRYLLSLTDTPTSKYT